MKGQKTVFLITDTQIKEEAFLEDIDSVLNTGEVPNIFAADEWIRKLWYIYTMECYSAIKKNAFGPFRR